MLKLKLDRIGADPEVFLSDGNQIISAIGKIGGSKTCPREVGYMESIQEDNVLAEFNCKPSKTPEGLFKSIQYCIGEIEAISGLKTVISSSEEMPKDQLTNPLAFQFGCEMDFSGWGIPMPKVNRRTRLRTAGGHIHLSFEGYEEDPNNEVFKQLDHYRMARCLDGILTVGLIDAGIENDLRRRAMYGRPGSFRFKSFGIEYRTPSNQWIKSLEVTQFMWQLVEEAIAYYNEGGDFDEQVVNKILNINYETV